MLTLLFTLLTAQATPPPPPPTPEVAMENPVLAPFTAMREALRTRDKDRFKSAWHPEGWDRNLVGSSGLSGDAMAGQAKSDGWVLRPDATTLAKHTGAEVWVVRCDIVTLDNPDKNLDSVYAVVTLASGAHIVVGTGEDLEQVNALAVRVAAGLPLPPPSSPK